MHAADRRRCVHLGCDAVRRSVDKPGSWICAPHRRSLPVDLAKGHERCVRNIVAISRWPPSDVNGRALSMAVEREAECVSAALDHFGNDGPPAVISDFMATIGLR